MYFRSPGRRPRRRVQLPSQVGWAGSHWAVCKWYKHHFPPLSFNLQQRLGETNGEPRRNQSERLRREVPEKLRKQIAVIYFLLCREARRRFTFAGLDVQLALLCLCRQRERNGFLHPAEDLITCLYFTLHNGRAAFFFFPKDFHRIFRRLWYLWLGQTFRIELNSEHIFARLKKAGEKLLLALRSAHQDHFW